MLKGKKILKNLVKEIKLNNELFNQLSSNDKRVQIAKDCLIRLTSNQFNMKGGNFFKTDAFQLNYDTGLDDGAWKFDVQKEINKPEMECTVCAKGGLFLSYVGRVNNVCVIPNINNIGDSNHEKLLELFSSRQLAMIEFAFEGSQCLHKDENGFEIEFTDDELEKLLNFYLKDTSDTDTMIAICNNIIENGGEFVL